MAYIEELEVENKELQKHIYNIQQQLTEKNERIEIIKHKNTTLQQHITQCENEIAKRENR